MEIERTQNDRGVSWFITYDDKRTVEVRWLWGGWCAHFTGRGPRGGLSCIAHVPMQTIGDLVYEESAYRMAGGKSYTDRLKEKEERAKEEREKQNESRTDSEPTVRDDAV